MKFFLQWTGEHRGIVTDCNFSHDSKLVVSCSDLDRSIKLWDASNGKMIKEIVGKQKPLKHVSRFWVLL